MMLSVFCAGLGGATVIIYEIFYGKTENLQKSTILAKINEETKIYTLDEKTQIGSFFDSAHRSYIPIDEIPIHMVRAMVASEDKNYFQHLGIDPVAVAKAFAEGVKNGFRFRRGGSTITQQTVKNILEKSERTFKRKLKELVKAVQLERMYSKNQILEFYLNQFHVTSNGRGIGIAAQYYFNKDVRDLSLVEAAFIAGSVKAPSKYNPFTKYTKERRESAWIEADRRKNYVLRRMYEQSWISKEELKQAWKKRVPFNKGKFRTSEVALMSLVKRQLKRKEILEALNMTSIRELEHAGLKIYTTIDQDLQKDAQNAMRANLSKLEIILNDFSPEDPAKYKPLRHIEEGNYYFAKITEIHKREENVNIEVSFGLPTGTISTDSLLETAKLLNLSTNKGYSYHLKRMLNQLKIGDVVFVEVVEYDEKNHEAIAQLRKKPKINGGLIALDKGEVRAVVAGFEASGFNRAVSAVRQPGSIFKSVVFLAALKLGWNIVDKIDNQRRVFPFQGKFYYPRPDHTSPFPEVSMVWAGIKSENLASIYLTANLLDKLDYSQFFQLMKSLDLAPKRGEAIRDFHYRVAKTTGVQLDNSGIREHLIDSSIIALEPDLVFSGNLRTLRILQKIWWGNGYLAEMQSLQEIEEKTLPRHEQVTRINLLKNNYLRANSLALQLGLDWDSISIKVEESGPEAVFLDPKLRQTISRFRVLSESGKGPSLSYDYILPEETFLVKPKNTSHPKNLLAIKGRQLNPLDVQAIWGGSAYLIQSDSVKIGDVKLNGYLPYKYFNRLKLNLEDQYENLKAKEDKYSLISYFNHHDFKIILGLKYLARLAKQLGVPRKIEPVLSFPLGTNEVSVADVAKIYQSFIDGKAYSYYKSGPVNQLNFIKRIEDRNGNILFKPERIEHQLMSSCISSQMAEILGKVVTHGTGRRANRELLVDLDPNSENNKKSVKIKLPAFGKTGTTNDYTTAYFAGFVPLPVTSGERLNVKNSYAIASYVGYDLNQAMEKGPLKISGAHGALPVWIDFIKSMIKVKKYKDFVDQHDIKLLTQKKWPLIPDGCTQKVSVNLPRGTILGSASGKEINDPLDIRTKITPNEFARNSSIKSEIQLAMDQSSSNSLSPRRFFEPLLKFTEELDSGNKDLSAKSLKESNEANSEWEEIFGSEFEDEDFQDQPAADPDFTEEKIN